MKNNNSGQDNINKTPVVQNQNQYLKRDSLSSNISDKNNTNGH